MGKKKSNVSACQANRNYLFLPFFFFLNSCTTVNSTRLAVALLRLRPFLTCVVDRLSLPQSAMQRSQTFTPVRARKLAAGLGGGRRDV